MPTTSRPRAKLTAEQAEAYAKLRKGILAIVTLGAPDADNLEAWLGANPNFGGPFHESDIVRHIALTVLDQVRNYDDRTLEESEWDRMVVALVSGA